MATKFSRFFMASVVALAGVTSANATIIADTYWGSDNHGYGDRIGKRFYEVYNMDVSFSTDYMHVRVNTDFDQSVDPVGIQFGDLFISNDGWHPYGTAPYASDDSTNGESWEFVFDTSEGMLYGGEFSILTSDDLVDPRYTFRNGQEVQRGTGGTAYEGSSVDLSHVGTGGYLQYDILLSSVGLSNGDMVGLKWGMTCANDTMEGETAVAVPEPGVALLFGTALLGVVRTKRKKA